MIILAIMQFLYDLLLLLFGWGGGPVQELPTLGGVSLSDSLEIYTHTVNRLLEIMPWLIPPYNVIIWGMGFYVVLKTTEMILFFIRLARG